MYNILGSYKLLTKKYDFIFVNNKRTVIAKKMILFRKYRYFDSLSNATHPIQIHRVVL